MSSIAIFSISLGSLAILASLYGLVYPNKLQKVIISFPRNIWAGRILCAFCCILAAREAFMMNMGGLNNFKPFILLLAPGVFICSIIFLKELLAARSLGGLFCLLAVPVVNLAALSNKPYFQVIALIGYSWAIIGIIYLMAPWQFRKMNNFLLNNKKNFQLTLFFKALIGLLLIIFAINFY